MRNPPGMVAGADYRVWARQRGGGYGGRRDLEAGADVNWGRWCQRAFAVVTVTLCAVGVGMIYWWVLDVRPPLQVMDARPVQELFRYGEPIAVEQHLEVRRNCQGIVSRAVVDGAGFVYPLLLATDPVLDVGDSRVRVEFKLPEILGPGHYRYREVARWRCNPLTDIDQVLMDVPFTVVQWRR